ncbi:DUF6907 domain-containing protein [Polymorphospora rubra]|uniref:Uncharacterized protein n=1 Tax=Polymorphospora rubra TaxID=338584 RepID=A0A810MV58_9ACTN|nr:hypothetical protein [Polymorphospora rubra]BCJ65076.1 hypothetical protein Prubr_20970 [Polymorphospora rubra]
MKRQLAVPMPAKFPCPPWCVGGCEAWDEGNGERYHGSAFSSVHVKEPDYPRTKVTVSNVREDDDQMGATQIHILIDGIGDMDWNIGPDAARKLAALLGRAADNADPMPAGTETVPACDVRLGEHILTPDGWQVVRDLLMVTDTDTAAFYTDERTDEISSGWRFDLAEPVRVRRAVTR